MTRLTSAHAELYLASQCFDIGPTGFVGASVQLLPIALTPDSPPPGPVFERLGHGHLTGHLDGVLEVSVPPSPGLDVAVRRLAADLAVARTLLARHGLAPGERAVETHREPVDFPAGTAAIKVRVDAGTGPADLERRWRVAQAVGPVLAAAFANSPLRAGRPSGWRSTRQGLRLAIDTPLCPGDPRAAWANYALDRPMTGRTSFRQALHDGRLLGLDDLRRHLDRLPAPLQARGQLELSMIDAQPGDGWRVAVAVTAALIDDDRGRRGPGGHRRPATGRLDPGRPGRADRSAARRGGPALLRGGVRGAGPPGRRPAPARRGGHVRPALRQPRPHSRRRPARRTPHPDLARPTGTPQPQSHPHNTLTVPVA